MREVRAHRHYEKPSEKKRRKSARARSRSLSVQPVRHSKEIPARGFPENQQEFLS